MCLQCQTFNSKNEHLAAVEKVEKVARVEAATPAALRRTCYHQIAFSKSLRWV
jgi:hypothetical protein